MPVANVFTLQHDDLVDPSTSPSVDTTGSTLITVSNSAGQHANTIEDSEGNYYRKAHVNDQTMIWYCNNPVTSATHTFTFNVTSSYQRSTIQGWSGTTYVVPQLESNGGQDSAAQTGGPAAITPDAEGQLMLCVMSESGGSALNPTVDWTGSTLEYAALHAGGYFGGGLAWKIDSGAVAAEQPIWNWTDANFNNMWTTFVTFKEVVVSDPGSTDLRMWFECDEATGNSRMDAAEGHEAVEVNGPVTGAVSPYSGDTMMQVAATKHATVGERDMQMQISDSGDWTFCGFYEPSGLSGWSPLFGMWEGQQLAFGLNGDVPGFIWDTIGSSKNDTFDHFQIDLGERLFLAFVFDDTAHTVRLYCNGRYQEYTGFAGGNTADALRRLNLGNLSEGHSSYSALGLHGKHAVYAAALTEDELHWLDNDGVGRTFAETGHAGPDAAVSPGESPVVMWQGMTEASGTRIDDSANSNDMTDYNTVGTAEGGAEFIRANQEMLRIAMADTTNWPDGNVDWTVQLVIKVDPTQNQMVCSHWWSDGSDAWYFYQTGSSIRFLLKTSSCNKSMDFQRIVAGDEMCIFFGWDSVNKKQFITMGKGTGLHTDRSPDTVPSGKTASFTVGGGYTTSYYTDSIIKRAVMFDKVLTLKEREWLYNDGAYRVYSDLAPAVGGIIQHATYYYHQQARNQ